MTFHASTVLCISLFLAAPALAAGPKKGEPTPVDVMAEPVSKPPVPASKPSSTNAKGFPAPSLKDWQKLGTLKTDASLLIDGPETDVETFEKKGDRIVCLSTNGVTWAFGWIPQGDATKGYILRDPNCGKKLTERWAPDTPFSAPDCAAKAKPK